MSFFICLLTCGLGFVSEASAVEAAPFIWWSAAPVERLTDGRTSQVLTLLTTSGHRLSQPEAYYRVTPLRRFNQVDRSGEALWYRGEWISTDPWVLRVEADGYVRVDVLAKAMIAGQPHWAQTWALLYSRSGKK
ncbi:MAG: hypothetical protein FWG62_01955, partial [Proteobacteria bacterium]|nr:hypothetical protein [Pseudomonadota bacterium]